MQCRDTHFVLVAESDGFVQGIERLMDPDFAKAIGAAARRRVLDSYLWGESLNR